MRNEHASDAGGFTLLELLVVLALAGLLVALVPASISAAMPGAELKSAALDLALTLRATRNRAVSTGQQFEVEFSGPEPAYAIAGQHPRDLPRGISLSVVADESDPFVGGWMPPSTDQFVAAGPKGETQGVQFYPDGSTSGALLELSRAGAGYLITVDWLTGRVTVQRSVSDARHIGH